MSNIPDDIRKAVEIALLKHDRDVSSTMRSMLAGAILSERERCVSRLTEKAKKVGFLAIEDIEATIQGEA